MGIEMCMRCEDSAKRNPSTHLPTDHGETTFCGLSELGVLRWSNEREGRVLGFRFTESEHLPQKGGLTKRFAEPYLRYRLITIAYFLRTRE
jgi:hypothetical protein